MLPSLSNQPNSIIPHGNSMKIRGLTSSILQQDCLLGYILAASANLGSSPDNESHYGNSNVQKSLKIVFGCGATLSMDAGVIRIMAPESRQFIEARMPHATHVLWKEIRMILYCIILMMFFNYLSHTSQDAYITFLCTNKGLNWKAAYRVGVLSRWRVPALEV